MYTVQSNVSGHIARLERELGVILVDRQRDGLTDEGDTVDAGEGTAYVLHAGTALDDDGVLVSAGGRVLSVVGTGPTLEQARHRAYAAVGRIELAGSHHRTDIARRAIDGEVSVPG